jgi:hypothetical protein
MADLVTDRAGLGILASSITPYNINLYRGILAEIPELQLHLLVSHGADDFKWKLDVPLEIRVTHFGTAGEDVYDNPQQLSLYLAFAIDELLSQGTRAFFCAFRQQHS